jgi:cation diffusion facilitator family transporter
MQMADDCCASACGSQQTLHDARWRRILWIALGLNVAMFAVESIAGMFAHSRSLQADALDFFGDAANYAISLGVADMALKWRARAAWVKGLTILLFGCGVLASAIWGMLHGADPDPSAMGLVGTVALVVNVAVALLLYNYRTGDANMRSVWICSRNDAINNLLVIGAGLVVFWTGSGLPDLLVAFVMALLCISGGWQILRQAVREIREAVPPARQTAQCPLPTSKADAS